MVDRKYVTMWFMLREELSEIAALHSRIDTILKLSETFIFPKKGKKNKDPITHLSFAYKGKLLNLCQTKHRIGIIHNYLNPNINCPKCIEIIFLNKSL